MTPVQETLLGLEREIASGRLSRARALSHAHDEFGLSETRYYQQLLACLNDPDALTAHPALIHRLERLVDQARRARRRPPPRC